MSTYLLLRDNKQTGPHTLDEIRAMGLKKYDLIWVEGKSAAWRYAGEINEMKAFAPEIEEQPFDRFFRRPAQDEHQHLKTEEIRPLIHEASETEQKPPQINTVKRYVSVTLPSGRKAELRKVRTEAKVDAIPVKQSQSSETIQYVAEEPVASPVEPLMQERFVLRNDASQGGNALQYVALGLAVTSIVLIIVLVLSNNYDIKTYPVSKSSASRNASTQQIEQSQSLQGIPAMSIPEDKGTGFREASAAPEQQTLVRRAVSTTSGTFEKEKVANRTTGPVSLPEIQPDPKPVRLSESVSVSLSNYHVNMFGGIEDIRVTVTNTSPYELDMVVVELQYLQANKKVFKTETLRFKGIDAGASMTLDAPKTNRGFSLDSRLTYITSRAAGVSENL